jgi:hypothetical protein
MSKIKIYFVELFTVMAWVSLLSYIFFCTFTGIKDDSIRDAWNILLFIGGFVWGKSTEKEKKTNSNEGTTTAQISATITQEPITDAKENNT